MREMKEGMDIVKKIKNWNAFPPYFNFQLHNFCFQQAPVMQWACVNTGTFSCSQSFHYLSKIKLMETMASPAEDWP